MVVVVRELAFVLSDELVLSVVLGGVLDELLALLDRDWLVDVVHCIT